MPYFNISKYQYRLTFLINVDRIIFLYYSEHMKNLFKLFFITVLLLAFSNAVNAKEVRFIHITDINITPENAYKLKRTIKEINSTPNIDFVVFGGNNIAKTNINNLNYFMYLLKRTHKKSYVLLGSSDVASNTGIDKKYYYKRVKMARFLRHPSKPNYVFKKKGYVFIAMDGAKQYFQQPNGCYTKDELRWLDEKLTKYKDKNVVILQHFPITTTKSTWLQTPKLDEYFEVLNKHNNIKAIVSGHYGYNQEENINGIYNIITESYSKNGAYKIIELNSNENFIGTYLVK